MARLTRCWRAPAPTWPNGPARWTSRQQGGRRRDATPRCYGTRATCSVQRGALQVLVVLLKMIEPLDRAVEGVALLQTLDLLFLRRDALGENVTIEVLDRVG